MADCLALGAVSFAMGTENRGFLLIFGIVNNWLTPDSHVASDCMDVSFDDWKPKLLKEVS